MANPVDKQKIRQRYKGISLDEIEKIPAIEEKDIFEDDSDKRVGVYARVSTDDPRQTSSFELQRNHYTDLIDRRPGWHLYRIYADEGISGTSLKHRDAFLEMIEDCKQHKIDLIVTKSVSRFARNIYDCIGYVRMLADLKPPVGVLFETENIYTLKEGSEMALSFIATLAQEESHTKSSSMNLSYEMRFSRGIFMTPELLGYDKDEDGNLVINEDEALTVRLIFFMFLYGYTVQQIAEKLDYYCVCDYDKFFDTLQNYPFKHEFIKDIPTDVENRIYRLEGYLFPATYSFYINEGSVSAINKMLNAFNSNVVENQRVSLNAKAENLGRSMNDIIIIASIIERETPDPEEMKNVASVFYNRLKNKSYEGIGGKLQSDATRWYPFATSTAMKESSMTDEEKANWTSLYDTTTFAGLPPGPICCPSLNAINAALNPNKTKYYYFFTDAEGNHYYAATYEKHLQNVANYG